MTSQRCEGCGRRISVVSPREDGWLLDGPAPRGLHLELPDATTHLLCFDCIGQLPDDPAGVDVWRLSADES